MEKEKSQRDKAWTDQLEMCDLIDLVGVESEHHPASDPDEIAFCQMLRQEKHAEAIEKNEEEKDEVVNGHGILGDEINRQRDNRLGKEMFRITQSIGVRIEDVGVEQIERPIKKLLLDPDGNPGIQHAVFRIGQGVEGMEWQRNKMDKDEQHKKEDDGCLELEEIVHRSLIANLNERQNRLSKGNNRSLFAGVRNRTLSVYVSYMFYSWSQHPLLFSPERESGTHLAYLSLHVLKGGVYGA
jgi:hypothetical protein